MLNELASSIWAGEDFQRDYKNLLVTEFRRKMESGVISSQITSIDPVITSRLIQVASAFALADKQDYKSVAYEIAISLLNTEDSTYSAAAYAILEKLGNFPAISHAFGSLSVPVELGSRMAALSISHRERNNVRVGKSNIYFTNFQRSLWEDISRKQNAAISAPTSSGKSFVVQTYVIHELLNGARRDICYIVPSRALITQVAESLADAIDFHEIPDVSIHTVPVIDEDAPSTKKRVFVLTQERLHLLLDSKNRPIIDLLIVDEAQNIGESGRGVLLYTAIQRVLTGDAKPQLIFICPHAQLANVFARMFPGKNIVDHVDDGSTVSQNLIRVDVNPVRRTQFMVSLVKDSDRVASILRDAPIEIFEDNRLAVIAAELGAKDSNLVYAGGPAFCESVARNIAESIPESSNIQDQESYADLSRFIKESVHPKFILAETVKKGVGYHYGRLPALVRKTLEAKFSDGTLKYLVCTSTLLHGVNLPAKNLFMDNPVKGDDVPLEGPEFWNLAGRAGRLGKEFEGNIFLLNLDGWQKNLLLEKKEYLVESAIERELSEYSVELLEFLRNADAPSGKEANRENLAVKLYLDYLDGSLDNTINTFAPQSSGKFRADLAEILKRMAERIKLHRETIQKNTTVAASIQQRLYEYFVKNIHAKGPTRVVPLHPLVEWEKALNSYRLVFKRVHTYIEKKPGKDNSHNYFAPLALRWMRGDPLPVLIESAISHKPTSSTASVIRETLKKIEEDLRFRYVKYLSCYTSVLEEALRDTSNGNYIKSLPPLALFMEMGASSQTMLSLFQLGISRITASSVTNILVNKSMDTPMIRRWLSSTDLDSLDMPVPYVDELKRARRRITS